MDKELLLKLAMKHLDVPGLISDVLDQALEPAIDKFVADSANPYDDMLKAAIYPVLKAELKNIVAEKWAELQA